MAYIGTKPADAALTSADIADGVVSAAKLATDAVETAKVKNLNVTNAKIAASTIDVTAKITGVVPTANLGSGTASSSTYLAGDSTYKTISEYDDNKLQSNIALLGFKCAVNGSLAKYNLQDQIIDEYEDATGIDASASTNENLSSGVYSGSSLATVTGGSTAIDGDYTVHTITATGSTNFITDTAITVDYLIVGGGGGGGDRTSGTGGDGGGGGGGAGVISATSQTLAAGTFAAVVGAGGAASANGVASSFNSQTAGYGGAGGDDHSGGTAGGATDGSGGGAGCRSNSGGAGDGNGTAGGSGSYPSDDAGGGGGGRGGAGQDAPDGNTGGDGGDGLANSITGSEVYYGAGGGGGVQKLTANGAGGSSGRGGAGGSVTTDPTAGAANSGSGGGGGGGSAAPSGGTGFAGGDGVVIIRRLTAGGASYEDLTLQSTDTTAMAEPDYADMVILMENDTGTATINVDIKGYISKDSGSTFTEGTLVDEGTWGTNKKIYAFHDLDISAQSGTSMCYKITTHNQDSSSKKTRIHATSIGWKA